MVGDRDEVAAGIAAHEGVRAPQGGRALTRGPAGGIELVARRVGRVEPGAFGPDLVTGVFPVFWAYVVGPSLGAALAVGIFQLLTALQGRVTLTAKLFHDPKYPSVHSTALPAKPHRGSGQRGVLGNVPVLPSVPATAAVPGRLSDGDER